MLSRFQNIFGHLALKRHLFHDIYGCTRGRDFGLQKWIKFLRREIAMEANSLQFADISHISTSSTTVVSQQEPAVASGSQSCKVTAANRNYLKHHQKSNTMDQSQSKKKSKQDRSGGIIGHILGKKKWNKI